MHLPILYQDNEIVVINKPHNLMVHKSLIAYDVSEFAIQILRDQIGQKVYPVHRLDRKTGGALVFALNKEVLIHLNNQFIDKEIEKTYHAIVRGFTEDEGTIDYPLISEKGKSQESVTHYKTLSRSELPFQISSFPTSRYSMVEVRPETGRMHQIRKHLAHIFHPIIADRPHGCNKQNRYFKQELNMDTMMLHASYIKFTHPTTMKTIEVSANFGNEFNRMLATLKLTPSNI